MISKCTVKKANNTFNDLGHSFELSANKNSIFEKQDVNLSKKPKLDYNMKNIKELIELPNDSIVGECFDVLKFFYC